MSKRKTIVFSVILMIVCFVLYIRPERVQRGRTSFSVEKRIDAGAGRTIVILLDDTAFEIPGWFFEIHVGQQVVVPTTFISGSCRGASDPDFKLLTSRDRTLVGLVRKDRPEVLAVVHDFVSGASWPRGLDYDTTQVSLERGRKLRDRLQADNPEPKLSLCHDVVD